jgi:hypothetical protein
MRYLQAGQPPQRPAQPWKQPQAWPQTPPHSAMLVPWHSRSTTPTRLLQQRSTQKWTENA